MSIALRATIDDLLRRDGKVELINGELVEFPMPGDRPGYIAGEIFVALREYRKRTGIGRAHGDGVDYAVEELASGRESFRPDASYYTGPRPSHPDGAMPGPPTLAVEVRSKEDYGKTAERDMAAKRADYFEAGTLVVWDVNPQDRTIAVYRRTDPERPTVFGSGEFADAEPAMPGFRLAVAEVFE